MEQQAIRYDEEYREILLRPIRTCLNYTPKMGGDEQVDVQGFISLYGEDPLYHWVGFDTPSLFAIHKAAGGMTSLYRQLGIGVERLAKTVLKNTFHLNDEQVNWGYKHITDDGKNKERKLDSRIRLVDIDNDFARKRVELWLVGAKKRLDIKAFLNGVVFEIREGYKSADSKRQNADLENSANALGAGYLMTMMVMSNQVNNTVYNRYKNGNLLVLRGNLDNDPHISTYAFFKNVIGYDLAGFFERNSEVLRSEIGNIIKNIIEIPN